MLKQVLFFSISSQTLLQESRDFLRRHRRVSLLDSSETLIYPTPHVWGSGDAKLNRATVFEAVVKKSESFFTGHQRDAQMMSEFVKSVNSSDMIMPTIAQKLVKVVKKIINNYYLITYIVPDCTQKSWTIKFKYN